MEALPQASSAGLNSFLHAKLVNGIDYFLEITGFQQALEKAAIVITGEGSIDEQTLNGKGPFGVALRAKAKGIPVIGLAGKVPLAENIKLQNYFDVLIAVGNEPTDIQTALEGTQQNLIRTSKAIGESIGHVKN